MASSISHKNAFQQHMVNFSKGLKYKIRCIFKFCECVDVFIRLKEVMDLSNNSRGWVS